MMTRIVPAIVAVSCLIAAYGQDVAGLWLGTLRVGPSELRLALHIARTGTGFTGTLDSIDQGASGIPLSAIAQEGRNIRIEIQRLGGLYVGSIDESGNQISGTWTQAFDLPLTFTRTAKLPDSAGMQEPKRPYPYDEVEVSYENKQAGVKFAGTLTLPRTGAPHPAVLLITGSGPQDRDESFGGHKPFLVLADFLTRRGIAVLRVDDRGVGGSTGSVDAGTTDEFAGDALAGVAYLKSRREIDPERIGLIGHSEGGIVASLAAARSRDVALIVLLVGPGVPGSQVMIGQSYAGARAMGASEEGAAMNRDLTQLMLDAVMHEKDPAAAERRFEQHLAALMSTWSEAQKNAMAALRPQLQAQMRAVSTPWFRAFVTLDPKAALARVTAPVLALNGDLDTQVLPRENLAAIVDTLEEGGNPDYTVVRLAGLNHLFQTAKTGAMDEYARIAETIAPAALETIGDWITSHTAR
jgi:pimeloyl-ACP methyl ester carboxylesterase